ncbi:MAG: DNA double-strand break repair nuclease NurA [Candidatus Korarchaeota archaeon]
MEIWEEERIPDLVPEAVTELVRKSLEVAQGISKHMEGLIESINNIRDAIKSSSLVEIVKLDPRKVPEIGGAYAVDSSFKAPLPLVYGDMFIVLGGYVRYPRIDSTDPGLNRGLKVELKLGKFTARTQTAISKIVEMSIAKDLLQKDKYSTPQWDLLIYDGPLLPLWPLVLITRHFYEDEKKVLEISREVAAEARNKNKVLIGIVKRVDSHFIERGLIDLMEEQGEIKINKNHLKLNDKALLTLLLQPGEALLIGSVESSRVIDRTLVKEGKKDIFMRFVDENSWVKDIWIGFMKPIRSKHVIRFEIADYKGLGVKNILHWLNANSSNTACPYPMDQVDKMTRITDTVYEFARKLIIKEAALHLSKIARIEGPENVDLLLEFADLQKKFIPDMG